MGIWPVEDFPLISKVSFLEELEEEGNQGEQANAGHLETTTTSI